MKKFILLSLIICMDSYAMSHLAKTVIKKRFYSTLYESRWPDYSIEQAFLIASITVKNNHFTQADAYDRSLKDKIEKSAALVCPDHHPSKCRICWRPQMIAFTRLSEDIFLKNRG